MEQIRRDPELIAMIAEMYFEVRGGHGSAGQGSAVQCRAGRGRAGLALAGLGGSGLGWA